MKYELEVKFDGLDVARSNRAAGELQNFLKRIRVDEAEIQIRKENADYQDMGSTVILVLGTPAVLAICKGISDYISKFGDSVVISTSHGTVVARGSAAQNIDVAKTVAALESDVKK